MTPSLDPSFKGRQIVDGNNFLLNRFQQDSGGLIIRNIMADVRACATPPVFVFDGANGNARRRELLPTYKVRTTKAMVSRESLWPMLNLFKSIMPFLPCITVNVPGWEADDVMATMANPPCRIITTDRDLSQLCVKPGVEVTAMFKSVPPEQVRLYKTLVGDPSDNIKGIPMFGEKSWEALDKSRAASLDFNRWSAEQLNMKPSHHEWAVNNQNMLHIYHKIIGLFEVPMLEIVRNLKAGTNDPGQVNAVLKEFLL